MERNLNDVDFENFIKKAADQYRMYPSEETWNGVHRAIHPRTKWYGFGLGLLLVGSGLTTMLLINTKKTDLKEIAVNQPVSQTEQTSPSTFDITEPAVINNKINQTAKTLTLTPTVTNNNDVSAKVGNDLPNTSPSLVTEVASSGSMMPQAKVVNMFTDPVTDQDHYMKGFDHLPKVTSENKPATNHSITAADPLTIESILNTYSRELRKKKLLFQVFFTPTISYRKLSENKSFFQSTPVNLSPNYTALYNINEVVTHKPDMGLEFGLNMKYPVTRTIHAKAGLQFNMSRYEIKAFNNPMEVATIALNNGRRVDSLNTLSNYRNFNGTKADWLKNFYFQVSLPVGAEVILLQDEKISFGIGSTIQPTYVLGDRAYLISSDYKNYSEVPWLIRRWNVNTSMETFVAYSTGKLNWQVGPQVRYQILSSFVDKYPVKENLFDFGLKVGIGLNE